MLPIRRIVILLTGLVQLLFSQVLAQPVTLNSAWEFVQDDTLTLAGASALNRWTPIHLPHTWNRLDAFDEADGYKQGIGWYRKALTFSKNGRDRILLKFEGANEHAIVFLNGRKVTEHLGGYTAFTADLTPHIRWGEENTLMVRVSNKMNRYIPPLSMDFTFYGGIYRDVWLIRKAEQHFDGGDVAGPGVYLETPTVTADHARLDLEAHLSNRAPRAKRLTLSLRLFTPDGEKLVQRTYPLRLDAGSLRVEKIQIPVNRPRLWTPDDPALYQVDLKLFDADTGEELDVFSARRGFRSIEMDEEGGLLLNGEPLKLIGACRHQDDPKFGSAMPDELHRRDVALLKEMGANFIRIGHYPQDPAVLAACDALGILAWEELPIVNSITVADSFRLVATRMLEEMIAQHRNYTSPIMWGLANEIMLGLNRGLRRHPDLSREQYLDSLRQLLRDLHLHAKRLDPDRWTTMAQHGRYELYEDAGLNNITDIVGLNLYYGWYSTGYDQVGMLLDRFHTDHPGKGLILSEFGGGSDPRIHAIEPRRFDFSVEWQTGIHAAYLPQVLERPHVMGASLWILADFNSEGRKDAVPHINSKGILNLDRSPKDSYLYYQAALADKPYLRIGSQGWRRRAGFAQEDGALSQPVFLFTNQPEVRVFLNGQDVGTFSVKNFHLRTLLPLTGGMNELRVEAGALSDEAILEAKVLPKDLRTLSAEEIDLKMNLGAHYYFVDDQTGTVWLPEQPYQPGGIGYLDGEPLITWNDVRVGSDREIFGSPNEPVYQTHRDSLTAFRADLPDGWYEVNVHFAEVVGQRAREKLAYNLGVDQEDAAAVAAGRHFHLRINGRERMRDIQLTDYQATSFRFPVHLLEGKGLTIEVVPVRGGGMLSGVEVRSLHMRP